MQNPKYAHKHIHLLQVDPTRGGMRGPRGLPQSVGWWKRTHKAAALTLFLSGADVSQKASAHIKI